MRAELIAAGVLIVSAVMGVRYWEANGDRLAAAHSAVPAEDPPPIAAAAAMSPYGAGWSETVSIRVAHDNQYYVTAAVNNSPASFLIDTGAGYVALRESDARKAGIYPTWKDYDHPVKTANGETKAARVTLRAIEISGIKVENVDAFILSDEQLAINLLGMSFLSKLESVEARGGELLLRG